MAICSIFEVHSYLIENKLFFQNLFNLDSNEPHLRQYVDELRVLLYKNRRRLTEDSSTAVIYKWKEGDFEPALCFEEIRKFIIENKKHIESYLPSRKVFNPQQCNAQLFNERVVQQCPKSEEQQPQKRLEKQQIEKQREQEQLERLREEQQRMQRHLEEQQRLLSKETRRHHQFITIEMSRIDNALNTLQQRISLVDQHHSSEAFNKATLLLYNDWKMHDTSIMLL